MAARIFTLALVFLTFGTVLFCSAASDTIALQTGSSSTEIDIRLLDKSPGGLTLQLNLPYLETEAVTNGDKIFQQLSLPDGGFAGSEDQPGLPTLTRLVALPAGSGVQVRLINMQEESLGRMWLAPNEPITENGAKASAYNEAKYQQTAASVPRVSVGEPALMHGLRVVPVTFSPVGYDPATGETTAAGEMTVEVTFSGSDQRNNSQGPAPLLPESFATLFEETVIGWERGSETQVGPGSMIYICSPSVTSTIEDLAKWRRRQGYNVMVVTTAEAGGTNTNIASYLATQYAQLDPPLEFVTLVGDATGSIAVPTFFETSSGYYGEGDHSYSLLNGNDVLADVHVGRLTAQNPTELQTVVNKILDYEKTPDMTDEGWFTRAGLTGDPATSGQSTIFTNQFFKQELLRLNYTQIDTIWGGNFVSLMSATINQGETFFTYRGLGGMSGMNTSHISYLSNGRKLPFAVILTCDTGSFSDDTTCRSEAFLKASNGGGIAAIGTATNGTHTRYNNCMFLGITDHITGSGDFRTGPALSRGKLNFYLNYWQTEESKVWTWSTWNNLMGDPATEIWTGVPKILEVDFPAQVSTSADAMTIMVETHGAAVAGARVALHQDGNVRSVGYSDNTGRVVLDISGAGTGDVLVTVTGHNLYPFQGATAVGQVDRSLDFANLSLEGSALRPGQTSVVDIQINNSGTNSVTGAEARLVSYEEWLSADGDAVSFGDLAAGGSTWGQDGFDLVVSDLAPGGGSAQLELLATSGTESWSSLIEIPVTGPRAEPIAISWATPGGSPDPGEEGNLTVALTNIGNLGCGSITGTLTCSSDWVNVDAAQGAWGNFTIGGNAAQVTPFAVSSSSACYAGHLANFQLELAFPDGGRQILEFQQTIGTPAAGDPAGPDGFGYYALDNTDNSALAPTYEWSDIELLGGQNLQLYDNGRYQDATRVMDLPFEFTYYGKDYSKVSICTNGWLSFGATDLKFYRNWYLPAAGTPDAMVAAFWDDLANGAVFAQYDEPNHRYIVQWSDYGTYQGNDYQDIYLGNCTFQVILLDPAYHHTDTGDGIIIVQYEAVTIDSNETNRFTAGIQNHDRDTGLTYYYGGTYAGGAAAIESGRAIAYRTIAPRAHGTLEGQVQLSSAGQGPVPEARVTVLDSGYFFITDDQGNFSGNAPTGTWDVAFDHPGCAPDTVRGVVVVEDLTTNLNRSLVDNSGPLFFDLDLPLGTDDTVGPYLVEANISDLSGLESMQLFYTSSQQGGPFAVSLEAVIGEEGRYQGAIPGQPLNTQVQYWLTARDQLEQTSELPAGAPWPVYSFQVLSGSALLNEDFESNGAWIVNEENQDTASSGVWLRGDPIGSENNGQQVQTESDHTATPGVNCWFTGQHQNGQDAGYNDVDGGFTTLSSPVYDLSGLSNVTVSYWRWYTNNAGSSPDSDNWVVEVSNDGGSSWQEVENTNSSNNSWQQVIFNLDDYYGIPGQMKLRFTASDFLGGSLVEAAIDDLVISGSNPISDLEDPQVVVTAPNGGESVTAGETMTVSWQATDDIGVVETRLSLSVDGGNNFGSALLTGPFNGTTEWTVLVPGGTTDEARLRVEVLDAMGRSGSDISNGDFTIIGGASPVPTPALLMALGQNHPNPFNPQTEIVFSLPRAMDTTLRIYDIQGRLVRTLVQEEKPAGAHRVTWKGKDDDGGSVASGTYFYRLTTQSGTLVRKMTLLK